MSGQDLRASTSFIVACETCISVRTLAVWWSFMVLMMSIQSLCAGGPLPLSGTEESGRRPNRIRIGIGTGTSPSTYSMRRDAPSPISSFETIKGQKTRWIRYLTLPY